MDEEKQKLIAREIGVTTEILDALVNKKISISRDIAIKLSHLECWHGWDNGLNYLADPGWWMYASQTDEIAWALDKVKL